MSNTTLKFLKQQIEDLVIKLDEKDNEIENLEDKIIGLENNICDLEKEIEDLEDEVKDANEQVEYYEANNVEKLVSYIKELHKDMFMYVKPSKRDLKTVTEQLYNLIDS